MRTNRQMSLDDAWRRGLIDRLERLETLSDRVAAAGRGAKRSTPATLRDGPLIARGVTPRRTATRPAPHPAPRHDEPMTFEELQNSLALALSADRPAAKIDLDAALTALTGEIGRIAEPAREAAEAMAVPANPAPPPIPAALARQAPAAFDDNAIVLPQALRRSHAPAPRPSTRRHHRSAAVAGAVLVAICAAGGLGYVALPVDGAGGSADHTTVAKASVRLPGRFDAQFGKLDTSPRPVEAPAPSAPPLVQVLPAPATVAVAESSAKKEAGATTSPAPVQVMLMTSAEPEQAPPPPIPKVPRPPAAAPAPVASTQAPARRRHRVAVSRKAPAEPSSKAPPARPVTATAEAPVLRPVPRGPRPSGALTLGGPPPTEIGQPSIEYRASIPAAPPSWLPKPDQ